jgi:hypothetical protein
MEQVKGGRYCEQSRDGQGRPRCGVMGKCVLLVTPIVLLEYHTAQLPPFIGICDGYALLCSTVIRMNATATSTFQLENMEFMV